MARATFVKAARQDYPEAGIKKGESYWWWKFRHGRKQMSKTQPKPSQLTQSNFLSQLYEIQERIEGLEANDSLASEVEEIVSSLNDLADECESNRDSMPDSLQDSDTGSMLQERADACRSAADELEGIDLGDFDEDEDQRPMIECAHCEGTGHEPDENGEETEAECGECGGSGEVRDEDAEPRNYDGETAEEYWQNKLEEVQGVSIDAG